MFIEVWKDVLGFEGLYQAGTLGNVRRLAWETNNQYSNKEFLLKPQTNTHNYRFVTLYKDGKHKQLILARVIWEAFNGPIPKGMQVNHINEDKSDNRLENLNLMTCKDNINWGTRNERVAKSKSIPILQLDMDNNLVKEWASAVDVENELGISRSHISRCCKHQYGRKSAGGFKWKYKEGGE